MNHVFKRGVRAVSCVQQGKKVQTAATICTLTHFYSLSPDTLGSKGKDAQLSPARSLLLLPLFAVLTDSHSHMPGPRVV